MPGMPAPEGRFWTKALWKALPMSIQKGVITDSGDWLFCQCPQVDKPPKILEEKCAAEACHAYLSQN
jgi:hypothetical protein